MANPYETLGVAPNASQDDIRKAYRTAAKETHPDLNPGKPEAEKRFKEINAAYDIVGDADKRKRYDAGEIDESGAERQPERHFYREYAEADPNMRYRRRAEAAAGQGNGARDFDYDIFADLFGGRGAGGSFRMPAQDVRYTLEIDFLDAVNGTHKVVAMPDGKTLDITIPAGINDGQVLRLKGQGMPGSDGKPGDAYVQISVRPHPGFKREGHDILSTLPVSLGEALNGAGVRDRDRARTRGGQSAEGRQGGHEAAAARQGRVARQGGRTRRPAGRDSHRTPGRRRRSVGPVHGRMGEDTPAEPAQEGRSLT